MSVVLSLTGKCFEIYAVNFVDLLGGKKPSRIIREIDHTVMHHMHENITRLMNLGMLYAIRSARAQYHEAFLTLSKIHKCCRGCVLPKDNLPKLLGALGLLSRGVFQAETSWVRVVEQAQQVQLDKPQPPKFCLFYQEGFRDSASVFSWSLWSWHSTNGCSNSFWHCISSDRFLCLPSVSVPFFIPSPSI